MDAWVNLAINLRSRYPDDWEGRLQSYKDGSNGDLQRWRALGGSVQTPPPPRPRKPYGPRAPRAPDTAMGSRNDRIVAAARTGTSVELIAERFGLSVIRVRTILSGFGERALS
jgi:hypothetical protein